MWGQKLVFVFNYFTSLGFLLFVVFSVVELSICIVKFRDLIFFCLSLSHSLTVSVPFPFYFYVYVEWVEFIYFFFFVASKCDSNVVAILIQKWDKRKKNEIDTPLPPLTHHHPQHQTRLQKRIHAILIKKKKKQSLIISK